MAKVLRKAPFNETYYYSLLFTYLSLHDTFGIKLKCVESIHTFIKVNIAVTNKNIMGGQSWFCGLKILDHLVSVTLPKLRRNESKTVLK